MEAGTNEKIFYALERIKHSLSLFDIAEATIQRVQINSKGQVLVKVDSDPHGFIASSGNEKTGQRGGITYNESDMAGLVVIWEKENDSNNHKV